MSESGLFFYPSKYTKNLFNARKEVNAKYALYITNLFNDIQPEFVFSNNDSIFSCINNYNKTDHGIAGYSIKRIE